MISEIKRKTLPAIAKAVGLNNEQGLLHFLTESPWQVKELRDARLKLILQALAGREIELLMKQETKRKAGQLLMSNDSISGNMKKLKTQSWRSQHTVYWKE